MPIYSVDVERVVRDLLRASFEVEAPNPIAARWKAIQILATGAIEFEFADCLESESPEITGVYLLSGAESHIEQGDEYANHLRGKFSD